MGTRLSIAFRTASQNIVNGDIPKKYKKILKHIEGDSILEVGSAEGVLSLLAADKKPNRHVLGLERHTIRYQTSLRLKEAWRKLGKHVSNCEFLHDDLINNLHLLKGRDTFMGIRVIYYFLHDIDKIFSEVSKHCKRIILGGNYSRSDGRQSSIKGVSTVKVLGTNPNLSYAPYNVIERNPNYYASAKGMEEIGKKYGYETELLIPENIPAHSDPLYIGIKK